MNDVPSDSAARPDTRRRWKRLGVLSAAVLLLHAAAFNGLDGTWPQLDPAPLPAAVMQVRVVDSALPLPVVAPAVATPLVIEPAQAVTPVVPARAKAVVARVQAAPAPAAAPELPAAQAPEEAAPAVQLALNTPTADPSPAAATPAGDEPIPHYRTRMPPAIALRYEMQRGMLTGTGDLAWRPQGDHYELSFEGRVAGLLALSQASTGGFDAAGVAPLRFADQRLGRSATAANFQRAAGKITFSGSATEFAMRAGAQDRLSWMVQLAAIVAAEPQLRTPGAKVVMYVVGARGDGDVWAFRCIGPEAVETGAGTVDAIKFVRESRASYDTTVQVWLDPQRHDLPVRATQKSGPNDDFDLRLREVIPLN